VRALRGAGSGIDADAWRAVCAAGWAATAVPSTRGGQGLGAFDLALALEQAGRQMLMVPLLEAAVTAWAMAQAVDAERTDVTLADLIGGARLIVPATAAAAWGFDDTAADLRYDHRSGRLDGSIPFVAYGDAADAFLLAADAPPVLALVGRKDAEVVTQRNVDGSTSSRLILRGIEVQAEHVIATGAEARRLAGGMQDLLALGAAAALVGLAGAALDITLDYIKLRRQFGKAIGSFQVLQHRSVDGFIDVELDRSLVFHVLAAFDAGTHHPAMVAAAKARASRTALAITRAALQMHGAIGYTEEHDIGLYYKRALVLAAQYGGELGHARRFSELTDVEVGKAGSRTGSTA
jgi:3-oxochol-4-en-24-oyl-CoA dehydrogenase